MAAGMTGDFVLEEDDAWIRIYGSRVERFLPDGHYTRNLASVRSDEVSFSDDGDIIPCEGCEVFVNGFRSYGVVRLEHGPSPPPEVTSVISASLLLTEGEEIDREEIARRIYDDFRRQIVASQERGEGSSKTLLPDYSPHRLALRAAELYAEALDNRGLTKFMRSGKPGASLRGVCLFISPSGSLCSGETNVQMSVEASWTVPAEKFFGKDE